MSTFVGADFFERENSEIVVEEAARLPILAGFLSGYRTISRRSAEERYHFLPREARLSEEGRLTVS